MTETVRFELDPLDPAQCFACCGLFELAAMRQRDVLSRFVGDFRSRRIELELTGLGVAEVAEIIAALKQADASAVEGFAAGEAPVRIVIPGLGSITLDWWLLPDRSQKSNFKLWAGKQTTLNSLIIPMLREIPLDVSCGFLYAKNPMSGRFGIDPRSSWNSLDFGSSPDSQGIDVYTYIATELLAAIGLQGFRPRALGRKGFAYNLWQQNLDLPIARCAISGVLPELNFFRYRFSISKRSNSYSAFDFSQPSEE